jgi:hypothetical protein
MTVEKGHTNLWPLRFRVGDRTAVTHRQMVKATWPDRPGPHPSVSDKARMFDQIVWTGGQIRGSRDPRTPAIRLS